MKIRLTRDVILPTGVILTDAVWNEANSEKRYERIYEVNDYIKNLNHPDNGIVFLYHASTKEYPCMYNALSISEQRAKAMGMKADAYFGYDKKETFVVVPFLDAQKYMDIDGFDKESEMIISEEMVGKYGISSYFINERWKAKMDEKR